MKKYYYELNFYGRKRIALMTEEEAELWVKCNGGSARKLPNQN